MNRHPADPGASDVHLVRQAQQGSPDAFAALVARYQDRVYNTCYRLCRDEAEALDLTQTTFLKALEALGRFEARSSFYTWLFRIAVNEALSQRRSQRRRPVVSLDDGLPPARHALADRHDVSRGLEQAELHEQLEHALLQLEPEFRVAVVLKDIEDLDYAAIAEILQVPIGTVKSRIYRGRMLLRDLLAKAGFALDRRTT